MACHRYAYGQVGLVDPIATGSERGKLLKKWLSRHANPDALGLWAVSTGQEAGEYAFKAIVQDPLVLRRAARPQASRLAAQAEAFALSLADSDVAKSDTWLAAAQCVQLSVDAWRASLKVYRPHSEPGAPRRAIAQAPSSDPWAIARYNFPQVDDETGMLTTRVLREFGGALMARVRKPWDHVIALGVLRYAARLLRSDPAQGVAGATRDDAIADILTVQAYAETSGLSPLLVGYTGPGRPALQALGLLRDARTLRDAVCAAAGGGEARASLWQGAMDYHAFGVVALEHRMLLDLPLDETYEIAAAAIRLADAAMRTGEPAMLPRLPGETACEPSVVKLHAQACLPDKGTDPQSDQPATISEAR